MRNDKETGELLSRACHDLRTPARGVRAHAELLARDWGKAPEDDVRQRLGFIVDGARRITEILDGLSGYAAALEMGDGSFQTVHMDALLRSVLGIIDNDIQTSGSVVTTDRLPDVYGDADRLMLVLEELIRNAALPRGKTPPHIHVSASRDDKSWRFAVQDDGPCVEADELERVFRPFERFGGNGVGLGLATCRAIIEAHGGRIWLESPETGGCTAYFTIPDR